MAKPAAKEIERKYEAVTNSSIKDVTKEVNRLIEKGYKPLGGIVVTKGTQRAGNPTTEQLLYKLCIKSKI